MRLAVYNDGQVVVTQPQGLKRGEIKEFIRQNSAWLVSKTESLKQNNDYQRYQEKALSFVKERIRRYNGIYGFKFKRISVRNQRTRWGSCSQKGNLSFNYRILFLPKKLADYIIVHELCHLKELNHSQRFWDLVSKTLPDYGEIRKGFRH